MAFFGVTWASHDREPLLLEAETLERALIVLHAWPDALNTTCRDYASRRKFEYLAVTRTRIRQIYTMPKDPYPNHQGFVVKPACGHWKDWPPEVEWVIQVYDGYIE